MEKSQLAKLIKNTCYLTGKFTLRSGNISSFYWDKYRFESNPLLLSEVADQLISLLPESFDKLAGLELGGIPIATALSIATGKHCLYTRKVAKTYGTCNLVEGDYKIGEKIVVIEDVITTGGQVCSSVKQMREAGLVVDYVVCVIDRQQGGRELLEELGCSVNALFTLSEIEQ